MKKLALLAMLAIGTTVFAEEYKYLTVGYNSMEKSIELGTIQKITFENGNVVVATNEGYETFPQAQMEKMFFSSTATGLEQVQDTEHKTQPTVVHDLAGRRVKKATKGIYIVEGKKVVIR